MTRSYNPFTRFRSCLVGFAVFSFLSAPVCVRAELTQAQVQQAFEQALQNFAEASTGSPFTLGTMPYGYDWELVYDLLIHDRTSVGTSAYVTLANLVGVDPRFWNFLRTLVPSNDLARVVALLGSVSNQLDKTETGSYANTVDSWLEDIATGLYDETSGTPLLNKIRNLTYTSGSELRVHDAESLTYLYNLQSLLYQVLSSVQMNGANFSSNVYEITQAVEAQTEEVIDYLDQDPSDTEQDAQEEVEESDEEAEESLEDTAEDYEYEMPELEEPDEPTTATPTDSSGVGDISVNVQHTPLITLTQGNASHTPSSPFLPAMEIDLMTTPGASNFISDLSTLIRFGWDAIFAFLGFLLYYSTFRRIRNMLIATRAGGVPSGEPFSIHYDPF